jgi:hypothetical protein
MDAVINTNAEHKREQEDSVAKSKNNEHIQKQKR